MNIPAEAVEAAVHAYMQYPRTRGLSNTENMFRAALEAAAPYLMRMAWDEGMETMYATTSSEWPPIPEQNPYRRG